MKATASSSVIGVSGSLPVTANEQSDREVTEYVDRNRGRVIASINKDPEARRILNEMRESGWIPRFREGRYGTVSPERGDDYDIGVVPMKKMNEKAGGGASKAVLRWESTDNNSALTSGSILEDPEGSSFSETTISVTDGNIEKRTYTKGESTTIGTEHLDPGGGGGDGDCVYFHDEYCANFNLSCISWLIAAIGISCGSSGGVVCLAGAGVAVGPYLTDDGCEICDEYGSDHHTLC